MIRTRQMTPFKDILLTPPPAFAGAFYFLLHIVRLRWVPTGRPSRAC
jgi:hypothetical protein